MAKMIVLEYYKDTGKYYTHAGYVSHLEDQHEIIDEVKKKRKTKDLPGLSSEEEWNGYILVIPEDGVKKLIIPDGEKT